MSGRFSVALCTICYQRKLHIFPGNKACRTNLYFPFWTEKNFSLLTSCNSSAVICCMEEQCEKGEGIQSYGGKRFMLVGLSYIWSVPPLFVVARSIYYTRNSRTSSSYSECLEQPFHRPVCNHKQHSIDIFPAVCATDFLPLETNACCLVCPVCRARVLRPYPRISVKILTIGQWQLSVQFRQLYSHLLFLICIIMCLGIPPADQMPLCNVLYRQYKRKTFCQGEPQ